MTSIVFDTDKGHVKVISSGKLLLVDDGIQLQPGNEYGLELHPNDDSYAILTTEGKLKLSRGKLINVTFHSKNNPNKSCSCISFTLKY